MFKEGAKLFGHPVHQMLIVFPLGLLATAVIFDLVRLATANAVWSQVSFYMIGAGIVGGLTAAVFGLIDWLALPGNTRAKSLGMWHGIGNAVVLALFAAAWALRYRAPTEPSHLAISLEVVGVGLAVVTGWLGGELVDRLGVGVDKGANANAPSSLTMKDARGPSKPSRPATT